MSGSVYYVYYHRRADDALPMYIGKGHANRAWKPTDRNQHWHNVANKHGFKVELIRENLTEEQAFELETMLIDYGRRARWPLTNQTAGGEGTSGWHHSEETCRKMSEAKVGINNPMKRLEVSRKVSDAQRGHKPSEKARQRSSEVNKGNQHARGKTFGPPSEETRRKISDKLKGREYLKEAGHRVGKSLKGKPWPEARRKAYEDRRKKDA